MRFVEIQAYSRTSRKGLLVCVGRYILCSDPAGVDEVCTRDLEQCFKKIQHDRESLQSYIALLRVHSWKRRRQPKVSSMLFT